MIYQSQSIIPGMVSVIMPAYNGEKYISQAIESVIQQTYSNWELIVVDDGSIDETASIVQKYDDKRIRYAFQENRGQAAALNTGLRLSQGEFITTLDVDDWFPSDSLFIRVSYLVEHPEHAVVYGDGNYCNPTGIEFLRFSQHMPNGVTGDVYDNLINSPFYGTGASVMERRQVLEKYALWYDETIVWCQDWDFYIRLAEVASFGYVEAITIQYRLHGEGMTMAMPRGQRLDSLIRTRFKVLNSPRFNTVEHSQKYAFFYGYMVKELHNNENGLNLVINNEQFQKLPKKNKSQLLRYVANEYLLEDGKIPLARKMLFSAWRYRPFDPKTVIVLILSLVFPEIAKKVVIRWKKHTHGEELKSPFKLALSSE